MNLCARRERANATLNTTFGGLSLLLVKSKDVFHYIRLGTFVLANSKVHAKDGLSLLNECWRKPICKHRRRNNLISSVVETPLSEFGLYLFNTVDKSVYSNTFLFLLSLSHPLQYGSSFLNQDIVLHHPSSKS
jgi:hypothetical protein